MLKILIPLSLVLFFGVSLLFFDGWPFMGEQDSPSLERGSEIASETDADPTVSPEKSVVPDESRTKKTEDPRVRVAAAATGKDEGIQEKPATRREDHPAAGIGDDEAWDALARKTPAEFRKRISAEILDRRTREKVRAGHIERLRKHYAAGRLARFMATEAVKVKPGDNLTLIARRANKATGSNVTPAMIMRVNGMRSDLVRIGQVVRVPTAGLSVRASKSQFRLYVLLGDAILLDYPIGTGQEGSTPEGTFTIRGKTKKPNWTMPDGRVVAYGHREHIIGSRWLGFSSQDGRTSYGIHGTTDEASVGRSDSDGCIRMKKADVEALFELIPEGCSVVVTP